MQSREYRCQLLDVDTHFPTIAALAANSGNATVRISGFGHAASHVKTDLEKRIPA